MARLASYLFAAFLLLALVGWASNAHPLFDAVRVLAVGCLMASIGLFLVAYLRAPDVPGGDRP